MTAAQIDAALHTRYGSDPWHYFSEVRATNGFPSRSLDRTIDGLAINVWPSQFAVLAFEIKVSRADFLREMEQPGKREPFVARSTEFWFVTPQGLVEPDEVPAECGLMWVQTNGRLVRKRQAQQRKIADVPAGFFAAVVRRAGAGQAYRGEKLYRLAGRDLTHDELLAACDAAVADHVASSGLRREVAAEERAKLEAEHARDLAVARGARRANTTLGGDWGWRGRSMSTDELEREVEAWITRLSVEGLAEQQRRRIQAAFTQLQRALGEVLGEVLEDPTPR